MSRQIPLTQGLFATVDDADFERANQFKWHAKKNKNTFYARHSFPKSFYLHTYLMDLPKDVEVDHKDGNGLNCQRYNLRPATHSQNNMNRGKRSDNTSGYKGVVFDSRRGKWRSKLYVDGHCISLGYHPTAEQAARAYDEAALKYHGEFARLNFS